MIEKIGPEQCLCGGKCNQIGIPTEADCIKDLCPENHYCIYGNCYPECSDLPTANTERCYCYNNLCRIGMYGLQGPEEKYCNLSSGCMTFPECPQDMTLYDNGTYCECNGTLMDASIHYCMDNDTIEIPQDECPEIPDTAPETDCVCHYLESFNNVTLSMAPPSIVCEAGLMCNTTRVTCDPRPDPCPSLPEVASPRGCYCEVAHDICEEGRDNY